MCPDDYTRDFEAMFSPLGRRSRGPHFSPDADIHVDADGIHLVVSLELAALDREHLTIGLDERTLVVAGIRRAPKPTSFENCLLKEIEYGGFERRVPLPYAVDPTAVTVEYYDGILIVSLTRDMSDVIVATRVDVVFLMKEGSL